MRCSTLLVLVALAFAFVAACDVGFTCKPGPWRTEVWSTTPRVEADLRDGCGFPDNQIDYIVRAHGRTILEGYLEHFPGATPSPVSPTGRPRSRSGTAPASSPRPPRCAARSTTRAGSPDVATSAEPAAPG